VSSPTRCACGRSTFNEEDIRAVLAGADESLVDSESTELDEFAGEITIMHGPTRQFDVLEKVETKTPA
jgi:hypothetical protein